ncbi:carbon-nitrogen hydrolase [candidate division LCP-89 bacterium B3_LCP]|uniref:Carbon-nitrogen hydrolase n=1 Tax=candidate division LCP-89 bacterium B3_LCP TaxID=2012998 RepID=A0A532V0P5_UNCL8|nr:MAG: carbon-nitrogen hydrolase [candidate division LCP-89 bacterium B3_LCP]
MNIGFIQFSPVLGDPDASIEKIKRLINQCEGADLVVLPELSNSGYNFESKEQAWELSEEIPKGKFCDFIQTEARERGIHIVAGVNERDGERLYNTAILTGPEGIIGKYRKTHLFWDEPDIFLPGDLGLPVFDIGECRLGILICFDWIFPEVWRVLALKGADLVCHPSNLVIPGLCQKAIPVHALTNRIYIITANRIGTEGNLTFTGLSTIADPKGKVLIQASSSEEEVGVVDMNISLARDKMITPRNHAFNDRRPELYSLLTENDPDE